MLSRAECQQDVSSPCREGQLKTCASAVVSGAVRHLVSVSVSLTDRATSPSMRPSAQNDAPVTRRLMGGRSSERVSVRMP